MLDRSLYDFISIHAPVKGATSNGPKTLGENSHFNPRSREGSDTQS